LEKTEKELKNLKKLYGLYADVIENISKWKEKAWSDFGVEQLNEMTESV
jgi:dynein heavy chain